jgi:hypothetical protein
MFTFPRIIKPDLHEIGVSPDQKLVFGICHCDERAGSTTELQAFKPFWPPMHALAPLSSRHEPMRLTGWAGWGRT